MESPDNDWTLEDLLNRAWDERVDKVHLAVGAVPLLRRKGEPLFPAGPEFPPLTPARLARELSTLVEPEAWQRIETTGEGDVAVQRFALSFRLTVYRSAGEWAALIHL